VKQYTAIVSPIYWERFSLYLRERAGAREYKTFSRNFRNR
jgi:hypothetical protein